MAITDELREYASGWWDRKCHDHLLAIADRIDAEHERMWRDLTIDAEPMTDERMAEHGWMRGPLDADGVMWRCGDMSDSNWGVIEGITYADGKWLISGHDVTAPWIPADSIRHYHAPTVEDVLDEFFGKANLPDGTQTRAEIIAEYAAKLRLAEEVGE